jgi:hypothetical protein
MLDIKNKQKRIQKRRCIGLEFWAHILKFLFKITSTTFKTP